MSGEDYVIITKKSYHAYGMVWNPQRAGGLKFLTIDLITFTTGKAFLNNFVAGIKSAIRVNFFYYVKH
jgi:hypothetical protein